VTISDFRVERVHFRIEYRMPLMSSVLWLKMMHSLHNVFRRFVSALSHKHGRAVPKRAFPRGVCDNKRFPSGEGAFPN